MTHPHRHRGDEPLSQFKHGWRPAVLGAVLGLLIGFAGGVGVGLVNETNSGGPPIPVITRSDTPTPTPTPTPIVVQKTVEPKEPSEEPAVASTLAGPSRPSATCGHSGARLVRFRVLMDAGLPTTPAQFVKDLLGVLCDQRSWIGSNKVRFRYDPHGSLLIGLRTPQHTEDRCMQLIHLSVNRYYSCGTPREVVLNSDRWFHGSRYWPGKVPAYRQMLVNHEVGHALGQHHRTCPRDGAASPVMMQQSKGMTTGGRTCTPNPWPLGYEKASLRS